MELKGGQEGASAKRGASGRVAAAAETVAKGEPSAALVAARTYVQADLTEIELHRFLDGVVGVFSARCPGKATVNEDACALIPFDGAAGVLAVADGAGGMPAGEEASRLAIEALVAHLTETARDPDLLRAEGALRGAILDGIEAANRAVLGMSNGAATTLSVVEIQGNLARPYHVGDSLILLTSQRGRVKLQPTAHSPVGYAVESGLLDESEAVHHDDRHLVSNLIGTAEMKIEVGPPIELAPRDTLVLASDALPDNLFVDEIVELSRIGPIAKVTRALVEHSRERMERPVAGKPSHPDDTTVLVFRLRGRARG